MRTQRVILIGGKRDGQVIEVVCPWDTIAVPDPLPPAVRAVTDISRVREYKVTTQMYRKLEVRLHGEKITIATCCENDLDALARFKKVSQPKGEKDGRSNESQERVQAPQKSR